MLRLNSYFGPVITQMTNTQKMNNYEIKTQNTPNLHVCSTDESESERIKADKTKLHICSTDNNESKNSYRKRMFFG